MGETSKVALVTGATRGIGQAIALALGRAGHTVIGTATTDEGAQSIAQALSAHGLKGCGMVLQVNDAAACDGLLDQIGQRFGPIGILVNNAGITRDNLSMRMRDEEWDSYFR